MGVIEALDLIWLGAPSNFFFFLSCVKEDSRLFGKDGSHLIHRKEKVKNKLDPLKQGKNRILCV